MKARVLITMAMSLFLTVGLYAQKSNIVVYSNMNMEKGAKEYIAYDKSEKKAVSKVVYYLNEDGSNKTRVSYAWNSEKGWISYQKYEYQYDNESLLANIVYTKWDSKSNNWSDKSENLINEYNSDGKLIAVKSIEIDNSIEKELTQR